MNNDWNEKTFRLSNLSFAGENFKRFTYFGSRHGRYFASNVQRNSRCDEIFFRQLWYEFYHCLNQTLKYIIISYLIREKLNNIQQTSYRRLQISTANMLSNLSSGNKNNFSYLKHIHNETITRLYLFSACSCLYMWNCVQFFVNFHVP